MNNRGLAANQPGTSWRELQDRPAARDLSSEPHWLQTPGTATGSFCGAGAGVRISPSPLSPTNFSEGSHFRDFLSRFWVSGRDLPQVFKAET